MVIEKNYPTYLWSDQVILPYIWLIYVHQEWMEDYHLSSCTLKCLHNSIIWEPLGCLTHMHIPQIKGYNLEQKLVTIMFVVYDCTSKAYCCLNVGDIKDNNIQGHGV